MALPIYVSVLGKTLEGRKMKKIAGLAILVFVVSTSANAQASYSRFEIFGGYSYFNTDPNGDLISASSLEHRYGRHGFGLSAVGNVSRVLGLVADFSYNAKSVKLVETDLAKTHTSTLNFLFGPRLTLRTSKATLFAHTLVGGMRMKVPCDECSNVPVIVGDGSPTVGSREIARTNIALAIGGGLDVKVSRRFSIRAFQLDYLPSRAEFRAAGVKDWTHNFRAETGIVFTLGGK
jgi:opacity protein-like surface antigen